MQEEKLLCHYCNEEMIIADLPGAEERGEYVCSEGRYCPGNDDEYFPNNDAEDFHSDG